MKKKNLNLDKPKQISEQAGTSGSLSLACGGWLYMYMFGVARAFQARNLDQKFKIAGCSAGALVGCGLALRGNFDHCLAYVKDECIPDVYSNFWGLFRLAQYISTALNRHCNLHYWRDLAYGQLQVAVTRLPFLTAERVTSYNSQHELFLSLMASSAVVPLASLVYRDNCWCVDGGITDFQPIVDKNTVRVSPFYFANADIKPSRWVPIWWAIVPPRSSETVDWLYRLGYEDTCRWIDNHPYLSSYSDVNPSLRVPKASEQYNSEPLKKSHPYDMSRRISFDRFFGYDLNELMHKYVAFTLDAILVILVVGILKPIALVSIYIDLLFQLACSLSIIISVELYDLSPMVALCAAFLAPHYYLVISMVFVMYLYKVVIIGPSQSPRLNSLYECWICIASLSLLSRFISVTLSRVELRKHSVLQRSSLMYRIVRHSL
mmetsp:Transcript_2218/g.2311  ORF Transcript_2218/g.2311 Transcript_2218/m.2311 type:complete len:434 (+) Transcript_2218:169-1470(+)